MARSRGLRRRATPKCRCAARRSPRAFSSMSAASRSIAARAAARSPSAGGAASIASRSLARASDAPARSPSSARQRPSSSRASGVRVCPGRTVRTRAIAAGLSCAWSTRPRASSISTSGRVCPFRAAKVDARASKSSERRPSPAARKARASPNDASALSGAYRSARSNSDRASGTYPCEMNASAARTHTRYRASGPRAQASTCSASARAPVASPISSRACRRIHRASSSVGERTMA